MTELLRLGGKAYAVTWLLTDEDVAAWLRQEYRDIDQKRSTASRRAAAKRWATRRANQRRAARLSRQVGVK